MGGGRKKIRKTWKTRKKESLRRKKGDRLITISREGKTAEIPSYPLPQTKSLKKRYHCVRKSGRE